MNRAMLIGNLGQDPETRYTPEGHAVTTLSIATSERYKDRNTGEQKEVTEWHRVVCWRRLGEIAGEYLTKGSKVYIEGKLKTRKWEKDGITRYSTEIVADNMEMLDRASGEKGEKGEKPRGKKAEAPPAPPPDEGGYPFDDDIPFGPVPSVYWI